MTGLRLSESPVRRQPEPGRSRADVQASGTVPCSQGSELGLREGQMWGRPWALLGLPSPRAPQSPCAPQSPMLPSLRAPSPECFPVPVLPSPHCFPIPVLPSPHRLSQCPCSPVPWSTLSWAAAHTVHTQSSTPGEDSVHFAGSVECARRSLARVLSRRGAGVFPAWCRWEALNKTQAE